MLGFDLNTVRKNEPSRRGGTFATEPFTMKYQSYEKEIFVCIAVWTPGLFRRRHYLPVRIRRSCRISLAFCIRRRSLAVFPGKNSFDPAGAYVSDLMDRFHCS